MCSDPISSDRRLIIPSPLYEHVGAIVVTNDPNNNSDFDSEFPSVPNLLCPEYQQKLAERECL